MDVDVSDTSPEARREVSTRLRAIADRLDRLPAPAASDLLSRLHDPARTFLHTAERLIARAAWTAATETIGRDERRGWDSNPR